MGFCTPQLRGWLGNDPAGNDFRCYGCGVLGKHVNCPKTRLRQDARKRVARTSKKAMTFTAASRITKPSDVSIGTDAWPRTMIGPDLMLPTQEPGLEKSLALLLPYNEMSQSQETDA